MTPLRNERGIALVITILVVTLLAITVVEFTFATQVDQRMTRNSLKGLQASLLVRSGVNIGEAFLLHDDDPQVDAFTEDWCPIPSARACRIDASELGLPDSVRLCIEIVDESGKINLNLTQPSNQADRLAAINSPNAAVPRLFQSWQQAVERVLTSHGVDPTAVEALAQYWDRQFDANFGSGAKSAGAVGTASPTPPPSQQNAPQPNTVQQTAAQQLQILLAMQFPSLADAGMLPGLTPSALWKVRWVLTALIAPPQAAAARQVNANTAPTEVLNAIVSDSGVVESIISQRQDAPLKQGDLNTLLAGVTDPAAANSRRMLGVRSSYFLILASAMVNPNPLTGKGGIRRSASMLVRRDIRVGVPANAPAGTPRWTLTRLDWQKWGGADVCEKDQDTDAAQGSDDVGG